MVEESFSKRSDFPGKWQTLDSFVFTVLQKPNQDKIGLLNISQCGRVVKSSGLCPGLS